MRGLAAALFVIFAAGRALAADLTVSVRTAGGQLAPNVVVTIHPTAATPPLPARFGWPMEMSQHDLQFDPFVLVVPVGATVSFPNQDSVRHHVYSFSPVKRFELKLYGKGESRTVTFDKAGAAAVGCNIHDGMVGFIKVVNTPYAAKTGASGEVTFRNLPAGGVMMKVWHPYLKAPNAEISKGVTLPAEGQVRQTVAVDLRTPAHVHQSY